MSEQSQKISIESVSAALEAVLFVASEPVTLGQLAEALGTTAEEVQECLTQLDFRYRNGGGFAIQQNAGRYQLTTAPEYASVVEKFLGLDASARLSRAAHETLAIVAYRQPITRPGIDAIRGVSSDGVIKSLLNKGLIQEIGRTDGPGRPMLFGTTAEFLQHFGLNSLMELPPYDLPIEQVIETNLQNGDRLLKD